MLTSCKHCVNILLTLPVLTFDEHCVNVVLAFYDHCVFLKYRHCVYIIKTIALVKKSDVGIFLKYVSPPDAVNMNLGSRQIWETFNERNPAERKRTQLKMCVQSILLMLKARKR